MRLDPHDTYSAIALIAKALAAPFKRLEDVHAGGWCAASLAAACQLATGTDFAVAVWLSLAASTWDYFAGVRLAKYRGNYSSQMAHAGLMGKISGVAILLLVRGLEGWVMRFGGINTHGYVACALTLGLIVAELRSIAHNRSEWGAAPIPILSQILEWVDSLASSWIPARRPTQEELAARQIRTAETPAPERQP